MKTAFQDLIYRAKNHHISAYAAQIAFFFFLSLFPFIIVFITLAGNFLDIEMVNELFSGYLTLPTPIVVVLIDFLEVAQKQNLSVISLSFIAMLWSTSRAYYAISQAFSIAYNRPIVNHFIFERVKGIIYTAILALALTFAMVLPALTRPIVVWILELMQINEVWSFLIIVVKWIFYVLLLTIVLSMTYYWIPQRKQSFILILPGTFFSLFSWWAIATLFNLIVLRFARFSLVYGTLASVAIMMLWLYNFSNTLIIGAEINGIFLEHSDKAKQKQG